MEESIVTYIAMALVVGYLFVAVILSAFKWLKEHRSRLQTLKELQQLRSQLCPNCAKYDPYFLSEVGHQDEEGQLALHLVR